MLLRKRLKAFFYTIQYDEGEHIGRLHSEELAEHLALCLFARFQRKMGVDYQTYNYA